MIDDTQLATELQVGQREDTTVNLVMEHIDAFDQKILDRYRVHYTLTKKEYHHQLQNLNLESEISISKTFRGRSPISWLEKVGASKPHLFGGDHGLGSRVPMFKLTLLKEFHYQDEASEQESFNIRVKEMRGYSSLNSCKYVMDVMPTGSTSFKILDVSK